MFKLSQDKIESKYGFTKIKDLEQANKSNVIVYAKRHPDSKVTVLFYEPSTQFVVREQIYSDTEIDLLMDVIDVLDKVEKKKRKKEPNFIVRYLNSVTASRLN